MTQTWLVTDFGSLDGLTLVDRDLPQPGEREVRIDVKAVGLNPADYKRIMNGTDPNLLPMPIGFEVAGVIAAVGTAVSEFAVEDRVLAFRVTGGYTTDLIADVSEVLHKPENLDDPAAANLLLVGTTAADCLRVVPTEAGTTVLVHGASGAVGVSLLQQLRGHEVRVIGTAAEKNFDLLRRFGAEPVAYGEGLEARVRAMAPEGISAAYDLVGTDEALEVSYALSPRLDRIVSIAAMERARKGVMIVTSGDPVCAAFRTSIRGNLVEMAARGELEVPVARTFPFTEAREALALLAAQHPGGKMALVR